MVLLETLSNAWKVTIALPASIPWVGSGWAALSELAAGAEDEITMVSSETETVASGEETGTGFKGGWVEAFGACATDWLAGWAEIDI